MLYVTPTLIAYATITALPAVLTWRLLNSWVGVLIFVFVYKISLYAVLLGIGGAPNFASQAGVVTFSDGRITLGGMFMKAGFAFFSAVVAVVAIAMCDMWRRRRMGTTSRANDSK